MRAWRLLGKIFSVGMQASWCCGSQHALYRSVGDNASGYYEERLELESEQFHTTNLLDHF
jgi:hypothetical protein